MTVLGGSNSGLTYMQLLALFRRHNLHPNGRERSRQHAGFKITFFFLRPIVSDRNTGVNRFPLFPDADGGNNLLQDQKQTIKVGDSVTKANAERRVSARNCPRRAD